MRGSFGVFDPLSFVSLRFFAFASFVLAGLPRFRDAPLLLRTRRLPLLLALLLLLTLLLLFGRDVDDELGRDLCRGGVRDFAPRADLSRLEGVLVLDDDEGLDRRPGVRVLEDGLDICRRPAIVLLFFRGDDAFLPLALVFFRPAFFFFFGRLIRLRFPKR